MAEIKAQLNYLRIAPRKVRLVADLIRGKKTESARNILNFTTNKSALPMRKLLDQAISNAQNNNNLDKTNLYISEIMVNAGPILKRSRPRARGSAFEIQKKTSHIIITLDEIQKGAKLIQAKEATPAAKEDGALVKSPGEAKKATEMKRKPEKGTLKQKVEGAKPKVFRRQTF